MVKIRNNSPKTELPKKMGQSLKKMEKTTPKQTESVLAEAWSFCLFWLWLHSAYRTSGVMLGNFITKISKAPLLNKTKQNLILFA